MTRSADAAIPVDFDPNLPPGTVEFRDGVRVVGRITGLEVALRGNDLEAAGARRFLDWNPLMDSYDVPSVWTEAIDLQLGPNGERTEPLVKTIEQRDPIDVMVERVWGELASEPIIEPGTILRPGQEIERSKPTIIDLSANTWRDERTGLYSLTTPIPALPPLADFIQEQNRLFAGLMETVTADLFGAGRVAEGRPLTIEAVQAARREMGEVVLREPRLGVTPSWASIAFDRPPWSVVS